MKFPRKPLPWHFIQKVTEKIGFDHSQEYPRPPGRVHFSAATPLANLTASSDALPEARLKASAP
jgi:hypothetical protein